MIKFPLKITLHCKFWLRLPGKSLLRIRLFPKIDTTHKPTIFSVILEHWKIQLQKLEFLGKTLPTIGSMMHSFVYFAFFFYKFKKYFFQWGPCTWERPEDTPAVHQVSFVAFCHLFIKIDGVIEKLKISVLKRLMIMWIMFFFFRKQLKSSAEAAVILQQVAFSFQLIMFTYLFMKNTK